MTLRFLPVLAIAASAMAQQTQTPVQPEYPRPLRDLYKSYFPFKSEGVAIPEGWSVRAAEIRDRIRLASGLLPMPTKTPLNPVIHGKVERDDFTVERVFFESFPGHFVTGSLYRPRKNPGKPMPGILCPHGHWNNGRFYLNDAPEGDLAIGAERWESGARAPLQARCVQLARMGCVVFHYDMLGNADSKQIAEHRSGKRPHLCGSELGSYGLYSPMADLRLQSNFGLQTWNSIRSVDFLLTLPDVDPKRIAVTGASGGGTQSMILSAIDERVAASFPCVMVSTAMQGGCTCENACYLRINQGNIDIAAATAPRPLGMTAADDWTKELETKGFPDLKQLYTKLGAPKNVMATFNIHWKHNYNHVSRTSMYGFMNEHFKLGFKAPVLESDFKVLSNEELTVWTADHPAPSGNRTGDEHEKAMLKHWGADSDKLLAGKNGDSVRLRAWELMIGRSLPAPTEVTSTDPEKQDKGKYKILTQTLRFAPTAEETKTHHLFPKENWNGAVVVWLSDKSLGDSQQRAAVDELIEKGYAITVPELYLQGAKSAPRLMDKAKDPNAWGHSACYTYGYNPTLLASRVHDVLSVVTSVKNNAKWSVKKVILVGTQGAGVVAAAAGVMLKAQIDAVALDTEGFRFANLKDQYEPMFVPGAVKYGDIPGLLGLLSGVKTHIVGEEDKDGKIDAEGIEKL
ncbi:MAG: acetylxylan esterase [Verrucomicrobiaceae bacterium]|nr:acetylxylan esterase [Verrucomicrobiaceae bacterium]